MSATFTPHFEAQAHRDPTGSGAHIRVRVPRRTPSRRLDPRLPSEWDRTCCEQQPAPAPRRRPKLAWRAGWPDFRRAAFRDGAGPVTAPSALPAAGRGRVAARLIALSAASAAGRQRGLRAQHGRGGLPLPARTRCDTTAPGVGLGLAAVRRRAL